MIRIQHSWLGSKAGGSLSFRPVGSIEPGLGQPGLHRDAVSKKKRKKNTQQQQQKMVVHLAHVLTKEKNKNTTDFSMSYIRETRIHMQKLGWAWWHLPKEQALRR